MQQTAMIRNAPAASRFAAVAAASSTHYELHYRPLGEMRCGFAFPCDSCGQVVMDELSERSLANYLYARAAVGYELEWPQVRRVA